MTRRQNILLAAGAALLIAGPLLLAPPPAEGDEAFGGSDGRAEKLIATIRPDYQRWIEPLWEPPGAEIESMLFGLQAALGAGALAYCLGYWRGRRSTRAADAARD